MQKIDLTSYGGDDQPFFGYDFQTGQVFHVPLLHAHKRSKLSLGVTVDVPGRKSRWLHDIKFAVIKSCKAEWLGFGVDFRFGSRIQSSYWSAAGVRRRAVVVTEQCRVE